MSQSLTRTFYCPQCCETYTASLNFTLHAVDFACLRCGREHARPSIPAEHLRTLPPAQWEELVRLVRLVPMLASLAWATITT